MIEVVRGKTVIHAGHDTSAKKGDLPPCKHCKIILDGLL